MLLSHIEDVCLIPGPVLNYSFLLIWLIYTWGGNREDEVIRFLPQHKDLDCIPGSQFCPMLTSPHCRSWVSQPVDETSFSFSISPFQINNFKEKKSLENVDCYHLSAPWFVFCLFWLVLLFNYYCASWLQHQLRFEPKLTIDFAKFLKICKIHPFQILMHIGILQSNTCHYSYVLGTYTYIYILCLLLLE